MRIELKTARFLSALAIVAICGCSSQTVRWPSFLDFSPPPRRVAVPRQSTETAPPAASVEEEGPAVESPMSPAQQPAAVETTGKNSPAASKPNAPAPEVVTLGGEGDDKARAMRMLNESSSRLSQINRSQLTGRNTAAYDQARGLLDDARKAMADNDYLAASSLAEKASLLLNNVAPPTGTTGGANAATVPRN